MLNKIKKHIKLHFESAFIIYSVFKNFIIVFLKYNFQVSLNIDEEKLILA